MLKWHEVKGLNQRKGYQENLENGVELPKSNETVLICRMSCENPRKFIYFAGHITEDDGRLFLENENCNSTTILTNGLKWAEFNQPDRYLNLNGM